MNDGIEPVQETVVSLEPGETGQVLFPHKFSEAGSSTVTVEIGARDALDSDNRRSSSIAVLDRLGVLLVDGSPSEEWLQGETDFLKIALTPFEEAQTKKSIQAKDLIEASVTPVDKLTHAVIKDGNQSVIVLANVPQTKGRSSRRPLLIRSKRGRTLAVWEPRWTGNGTTMFSVRRETDYCPSIYSIWVEA